MIILKDAVSEAVESLYAALGREPVVVTPANTSALEERVRVAVTATGYAKPFEVQVVLIDEGEFVEVKVKSGIHTETLPIRWEDKHGNILVRVDTDGDGQ